MAFGPHPVVSPPKILFHACRGKGYPVILERGLTPAGRAFVPLADTREMALRIGRRRDPDPILLTVLAASAEERGVVFRRPQEHVYLVEELAPEFFTGPPLPKEKPETVKKPSPPPAEQPTPGSFFLNVERGLDSPGRGDKSKKKKKGDAPDWKRSARKERRKGGWEK
ncbi:MAG: RNA 2'-phosphotransferase [Pseudomonadota bacterium]